MFMLDMPGELALQKYIKHNYPFAGHTDNSLTVNYPCCLSELLSP